MVGRVAVIGAGSSGLVCTKICVEEGLEPVCFESSNDIGGLWNFKHVLFIRLIYRSLVTNTSKEMTCFSDFPMPDHYPNYTPNSLLLQYYRLYAQHFDLLKYIHFQVGQFNLRPDFPVSGQQCWERYF
uniref:Flavin-containing monooxygenase n=1 Tax=Neogobius melanostomus TaxID=47308 RepID=A0A8C6WLQ9_9GOBI